jgi:hypothetical protein
MAKLGIKEAFARYGATLNNPRWSVSAWAPDGSLVVSLWNHHYRKGPPRTMEFADSLNRWSGHGNKEFRENIARAHSEGIDIRLVIVKTDQITRVQAGEDAKDIPKEFFLREDLVGKVIELDGENYAFRFEER